MTTCKITNCFLTVYNGEYCPKCKQLLIQFIENGLNKLKIELENDIIERRVDDYIEMAVETNNFSK